MTEVGVSLALRRHRSLIGSNEGTIGKKRETGRLQQEHRYRTQEPEQRRRQRYSRSPCSSSRTAGLDGSDSTCGISRKATSPSRRIRGRDRTEAVASTSIAPYSSWQIFLEMAALYAFCMVLPTILGGIVRSYKASWQEHGIFFRIATQACSISWLHSFSWCRSYRPMNWTSLTGSSAGVLAPDAGVSDLAIVVLLSLSMAFLRVTLVHYLVPNYKQPRRLEALVRCKSIHLLSSSYPGSVTPTKTMMFKSFDGAILIPQLLMPNLDSRDEGSDGLKSGTTNAFSVGPTFSPMMDTPHQPSPADDVSAVKVKQPFVSTDGRLGEASWVGHSNSGGGMNNAAANVITRSLSSSSSAELVLHRTDSWHSHHDVDVGYVADETGEWFVDYDDDDYNDDDIDDDNQFPAPAVSSGLLTNSSAQNLQALLEQVAPPSATDMLSQREFLRSTNGDDSTSNSEPERLFAAPKYATAVFRFMYCLVSCLTGYIYFVDADFWPPVVGGRGSTKNCWDLSSVGATVIDSDFDQRNTVLRRYYLIQASYHFHSAAFHVLTSLLLWFVSKSSRHRDKSTRARFLGFIPAGMFTLYNVRTFFQHCFSVVLIGGTYLFSSTRRLGAIAMFSFDASSLFLHLLQLGINAPHGSPRSSPASIRILHRVLVVPAFCYTRFYIFPFVVGYSALEESQDWLRQLENMLVPGTAKFIHNFFVVAFLLFMSMNLVYFWRLLNHPHVMEALKKPPSRNEEGIAMD